MANRLSSKSKVTPRSSRGKEIVAARKSGRQQTAIEKAKQEEDLARKNVVAVKDAGMTEIKDNSFEDTFLEIVNFLPESQRGQAFSFFSQFKKLPDSDKAVLISTLEKQAREATGPFYELMTRRAKEDFDYNAKTLSIQKAYADRQFDLLSNTVNENLLRGKSKTNRTLAKALQRVSSNAFLTNVSGGIVRRRNQENMEAADEQNTDLDIQARNQLRSGQLSYDQAMASFNNQMERISLLNQRGEFDRAQEEMAASASILIDLFGAKANEVTGETLRNVSETGGAETEEGFVSELAKNRSAREAGGSDLDRQERFKVEQNQKAIEKATQERATKSDDIIRLVQNAVGLQERIAMKEAAGVNADAEIASLNQIKPQAESAMRMIASGDINFANLGGDLNKDILSSGFENSMNWVRNKTKERYFGGGGFDNNKIMQDLSSMGDIDVSRYSNFDFTLPTIPQSYGSSVTSKGLSSYVPTTQTTWTKDGAVTQPMQFHNYLQSTGGKVYGGVQPLTASQIASRVSGAKTEPTKSRITALSTPGSTLSERSALRGVQRLTKKK